MENHHEIKNGKPSISMGHLYHGYVTNNQMVYVMCVYMFVHLYVYWSFPCSTVLGVRAGRGRWHGHGRGKGHPGFPNDDVEVIHSTNICISIECLYILYDKILFAMVLHGFTIYFLFFIPHVPWIYSTNGDDINQPRLRLIVAVRYDRSHQCDT